MKVLEFNPRASADDRVKEAIGNLIAEFEAGNVRNLVLVYETHARQVHLSSVCTRTTEHIALAELAKGWALGSFFKDDE